MTRIGGNIPRPWCSPCPVWDRSAWRTYRDFGRGVFKVRWSVRLPAPPVLVATDWQPD